VLVMSPERCRRLLVLNLTLCEKYIPRSLTFEVHCTGNWVVQKEAKKKRKRSGRLNDSRHACARDKMEALPLSASRMRFT